MGLFDRSSVGFRVPVSDEARSGQCLTVQPTSLSQEEYDRLVEADRKRLNLHSVRPRKKASSMLAKVNEALIRRGA